MPISSGSVICDASSMKQVVKCFNLNKYGRLFIAVVVATKMRVFFNISCMSVSFIVSERLFFNKNGMKRLLHAYSLPIRMNAVLSGVGFILRSGIIFPKQDTGGWMKDTNGGTTA